MSDDAKIQEFILRSKESGASDQALVGILSARGWAEKQVYDALAAYYERVTGAEAPRHAGTGTAAKDAFYYLVTFSSLGTWTFGVGALAFSLIDRWLADSLFSTPISQGYEMYETAESIASIVVAFPIYLLVSKALIRDETATPEKLNSPVRKWLTYMSLVIAACVFTGGLIAILTYFLRGEITSRFMAKAFVVLVLSGGVFFYYFSGLKRTEESAAPRRETWMFWPTVVVILALIVLGFAHIGSPSTQRALRADQKRVQDLHQISSQIHLNWNSTHKLPQHLDEVANLVSADPVSRTAYEYHVRDDSHYELCATFALDSAHNEVVQNSTTWSHPAGHYCFLLDASQMLDFTYSYSPD